MTSPIEEAARYLDLDDSQREYVRELLREAEQRGRLAERTDPTTTADCDHPAGDEVTICLTCLIREYAKLRPNTTREAVATVQDLCARFRLLGVVLTRTSTSADLHFANGLPGEVDCVVDAGGDLGEMVRAVKFTMTFPNRETFEQLAVLEETDA